MCIMCMEGEWVVENEMTFMLKSADSAPDVTAASTDNRLSFTVYGTPVPQGSMRAFYKQGMKRPIITADNPKTKPWRQEIASVALEAMKGRLKYEGPVWLYAEFYFEKPQKLKKGSAGRKITKPDLSKLIRALEDALTGHIYRDDAQIVSCMASKYFGSPARCEVRITGVR